MTNSGNPAPPGRSGFSSMALWAAALMFLLGAATALPIDEAATLPRFDVVSAKRIGDVYQNRLTPRFPRYDERTGRFDCTYNLVGVLHFAFSLEYSDLGVSGPDWLQTVFYEISAVAERGTTRDKARLMLQSMLADRFGLKFHREERRTSVYAVGPGKGQLRLVAAAPDAPEDRRQEQGHFRGVASLHSLAAYLSRRMDRPVLDATSIKGKYLFDLDLEGDGGPNDYLDLGTVMSAVRGLGLKIEAQRVPLNVFVVDHINREPTPN
jgi:uncharacterized protein (TIGR03435 family)